MKTLLLAISIFCDFCLQLDFAHAQTWGLSGVYNSTWGCIASSADGSRLVALNVATGWIYTSTNSGLTWATNGIPGVEWQSVASSADGSKLIAVAGDSFDPGSIYTSTNAGLNWTSNNVGMGLWTSVAMSADGTKLMAAACTNWVYRSYDSGTTWTSNTLPVSSLQTLFVHSSADGTKLVVAGALGPVFVSTNSGASWIIPVNVPNADWQAIASSADGRKVAMAGYTNGIYVSTDYGLTWRSNNVAGMPTWTGIACSADGGKLVAVAKHVGVFISTNSGIAWTQDTNQMNAPFYNEGLIGEQLSIICSADATKLILLPGQENFTSFYVPNDVVWTSYSVPAPQLNPAFLGSNLVLSWTVPSTNFVLQQNSDLTANWNVVTNAVKLNLSNLQNQVCLSPTNSSSFFRLTSP